MRSAKEAAERTAKAKLVKANETWLKFIQQTIDGASAAGLASANVEFAGNQLDNETAQEICQALLDAGYTVVMRHIAKTQIYKYSISW